MTRSSSLLFAGIAVFLLAAPAGAQITQKSSGKGGVRTTLDPRVQVVDEEHYGIEFGDDLLDGAGHDGTIPMISVRIKAVRSTLIRPRTHFVPELLKSVELM